MPTDMEAIRKFISVLMSTISNCSLYTKNHASIDELTQKALSILNELLTGSDRVEIMLIENDLIVNKAPLRDVGVHGNTFIKRIKRRGISRIDFLAGITFAELKQFIADMSETDKEPKTYPHIKTGVIDVRLGGVKVDANISAEALSKLTTQQLEKVKDVYHDFSPFSKLNVAGLEEIVVNFIVTFKKEANILKLISPVKSHSEYTYTHATNVAVLSMVQAESLGVKDKLLQDVGIAALLHDVGKMFISKEILDKKGTLDEKEWQEMHHHTMYGSKYLARIDGLSRIAPIVALEHHLAYDGHGYPKLNVRVRKQHICSQIVAISDFFDALRSRRPYKRDWDIKEILALMQKNAGTDFNPFLADNFSKIIMTTLK